MPSIKITTDHKPAVTDAIDMYLQIGWGTRDDYNAARLGKAFDHSKFILAYSDETLIGLVRFLSDEAHETNVSEFLVRPEFQKQGIGKMLLQKLHETHGHTDIYISTPKENEAFFLKNGLKSQNSLVQVSRKAG